jgi:hypothetical protein
MLLLYLVGISGLLFLSYGIVVVSSFHSSFPSGIRLMIYATGLLLGGSAYAASFYKLFGNTARSIQFINLPASAFEKFLLGFIFTQIIYLLCYVTLFSQIDQFMCYLYNTRVSIPEWIKASGDISDFKATPLNLTGDPEQYQFLILFAIISCAMYLGSVSFNKNAFIKTLTLLIIYFFLMMFLNSTMLKWMVDEEIMPHGKFVNDSFRIDQNMTPVGVVVLPDNWSSLLNYYIPVGILLLCWMATYYKFKEKQV